MRLKVPDTKVTRASVYKEAGEARYAEAKYLEEQSPSGAIYLAGYLVECYLKWALCERSGVQYLQDLPDKNLVNFLTSGQGHNLERLSDLTGYSGHIAPNGNIKRAFQIAAAWSPNIRYIKACGGRRESVLFLAAVKVLCQDIVTWANQ